MVSNDDRNRRGCVCVIFLNDVGFDHISRSVLFQTLAIVFIWFKQDLLKKDPIAKIPDRWITSQRNYALSAIWFSGSSCVYGNCQFGLLKLKSWKWLSFKCKTFSIVPSFALCFSRMHTNASILAIGFLSKYYLDYWKTASHTTAIRKPYSR